MLVKKLPLLLPVYAAIVVAFCLTFGGGVFALTVEPDEFWILMSTMKAFGLPLSPTSALDHPVTTSGGLHFILHGLLALWQGGDILFHRLVSIGVTLILLAVVFKLIERQVKDRMLAMAGTALFAAAPGFLLQASLATSEIVATTTFLLATLFWIRYGHRSFGMALLGGVLFGLACATRMTCLSMLPAILVWSMLARQGWRARFVYPVLAVAMAVLVFVAFKAVYVAAFGDTRLSQLMAALGSGSGVSVPFEGIEMRLNYLVVADGVIPVLAILALVGWFMSRLDEGKEDRGTIELCGFLLLAGAAGWFAWVLKAPIPHIRYLWPAIPLLWLTAILLGMSALSRSTWTQTVVMTHVVLILMCAAQGLLNMRMLAVGDSLALVYEFARGTRLATPTNFFAPRKSQETMAGLMASLPPSANVYALAEEAAYPMAFLSGRPVKSIRKSTEASAEDYVLVQPSDYYRRTNWDLIGWVQGNTTLMAQHGKYELRRVREGTQGPAR